MKIAPHLLLSLLACAACNSSSPTDVLQTGQTSALIPSSPITKLDILFVVDNSGSMQEEQAKFLSSIPGFFSELAGGSQGMPDLHIATVSTTVSGGPWGIMGCPDGGGGEFQPPTCAEAQGNFLIDSLNGDARQRNYTGELNDALSCMIELGTDGCGFEQPLAAMERALDGRHESNAGFLRDDAMLAVVIISDEDDCSVSDTALFDSDPNRNSANSDLGFLTSFRCFEFGTQCDESELRSPGEKTNCKSKTESAYMNSVQYYTDFLAELKGGADKVMVFTIQGPPDEISVDLDDEGRHQILPSCDSPAGVAFPGVRLAEFSGSFELRGFRRSICQDSYTPFASSFGAQLGDVLDASPCLQGNISDGNRCVVEETVGLGTASEFSEVLPLCDDPIRPEQSSTLPCYSITNEPNICANTLTHLAVDVEYGPNSPVDNAVLRVSCPTDESAQ